MGAWITRLQAGWPGEGRSDPLARGGAVASFVFVAASWIYLEPTMSGPPWHGTVAAVLMVILVVCLSAMWWTDVWPLRMAIILALITLSELLAGVSYRQDSDSLLLAHSMVLAASSPLVLSLRATWRSAVFTGLLAVLVLGHTLMSSAVHGLGPTTLLIVAGAWYVMFVVRYTAPKALESWWKDQEVRAESAAAQAVARARIDASAAEARVLHDTVLRSLTLLARGGVGAAPDELRDMLTANAYDAGGPGLRTTSSDAGAQTGREPGEAPAGTQGAPAAVEPCSELAVLLTDRARHHCRNGFVVDVFGEAGTLPPATQWAIIDAAEECMVNAARHAGTDHVDVLVSRSGSVVTVLVSDAGRGFDPATIPAERFGVRNSVVERMGGVGGRAKVMSAVGRGTTIVLEADAA
ncbi:Signal transduction histidine kinase [Arthrobacter sp. cf158]|uniref:sensor histidine kinase n=1 Tax=Arthrobacter sp. cf158 TaxID=1761744 RepID=UPI000894FAC4|nr:ATP-binding protein [Arthrobacter sp. cf158]SDW01269.1 Signal transduction histidine kinase [Arthrobacter sp. cf158]